MSKNYYFIMILLCIIQLSVHIFACLAHARWWAIMISGVGLGYILYTIISDYLEYGVKKENNPYKW